MTQAEAGKAEHNQRRKISVNQRNDTDFHSKENPSRSYNHGGDVIILWRDL